MKYIATGKQSNVQMLFKYSHEGYLILFEITGHLDDEQKKWIQQNYPWTESDLEYWRKKSITVRQVSEDLSFANFWKTYNYKVGNKKRAEKLWNIMSEADKSMAIIKIALYNQYLQQRPAMERLYPETYLSQRRYENEYK